MIPKTYVLTLVIMLALTIFSLITGNDIITVAYTTSHTYTQVVNGSSTELDLGDVATQLSFDPLIQAVIWISIISGVAVAGSITILSSGLSEIGTHWLTHAVFYVALWTLLSGLAFPLITSISTIGSIFYWTLTVIYAIGVIQKIGSG